jgi:hypothetical protein
MSSRTRGFRPHSIVGAAVATAAAVALTAAPAFAMPAASAAAASTATAGSVHTENFADCMMMIGPLGPLGLNGPIPQYLFTNPAVIPGVLRDIFFGSAAAGGIFQVCASPF